MNLQVLPLKVLVSRQVIKDRMDYTNYLAGKTKSEMDILDRLAGRFIVQTSELTVERYMEAREDEDELTEFNVWEMQAAVYDTRAGDDFYNILYGKEDISIVETSISGARRWDISDVDGLKKSFQLKTKDCILKTEDCRLGPEKWGHVDSFVEDGKLMMNKKVFAMAGNKVALDKGDQGLAGDYFDSISTDKQGNLVRKFTCSMPIPNIKVTKVTSAIRVVSSDKENDDDPRIAQCADCTVGSPSI